MITIIEHIQYLLIHHDCVVLPGWGAFIAQYQPAHFSGDGCRMSAPVRVIGFNAEIRHDDGILASSIARREGMSYDSAKEFIANETSMLHHRLTSLGCIEMPRIGVFNLVNGDNVEFTPCVDMSIASVSYMGLPPVILRSDDDALTESHILEVPVRRYGFGRMLRIAASVAVVFGIGITASTFITVNEGEAYQASLGVPNVSGVKSVTLPQSSDTCEGRVLYSIIPDPAEATATVDTYRYRINENDRYYLIVASYETLKGAERYMSKHSDSDLRILKRDGRYRIYVATGKTFADAMSPKNTADFNSRYPDAWVYAK